ncbi:21124_t:CDS:2, partial [Dentiscutata erythropus]
AKQKELSLINAFDDFIIFSSIIIYPLINGFQWFPYYTDEIRNAFLIITIVGFPFLLISYILYKFAWPKIYDSEKYKENKQILKLCLRKVSVYLIIIILSYLSKYSYDMVIYGDYTDFNANQTIQFINPNISYVSKICVKEFSASRFVLTIYPAVVSGYLLSTNSTTTKIAFLICSLSLSRLIDHFGDNEPKK